MLMTEQLHPPHPQPHNKIIQGYQLSKHKLGQGQFGQVFLGTELSTSQKVAIKVIDRSRLQPNQMSYLSQQITALKNLHSDYIIKFHDVKKTTHHFYLIVEYCEGGDMSKYIAKKGRLKEEEALHYFYQIVKGFRSIVRAKLIHRDLKPANVFFKDGEIKIGDFGLAKVLTQDTRHSFAGSPFNMAPQILSHKQYDNRADIYSIGTVLYQMLFGTPPFYSSNLADLLTDIKSRRFNGFNRRLITPQTCTLLNKLLVVDPQQRMTWDELFSYEATRTKKQRERQFKNYNSFMNTINLRNMHALPGIFCLANPQWKYHNTEEVRFLDVQLNTQMLLALIRNTTFEEAPRDE